MRYATFVLSLSFCLPCSARQSGPEGERSAPRSAGVARADARARVEALADRNPKPKLLGDQGEQIPIFDPKFDWDEYGRVYALMRGMAPDAEGLWPELVKHLADDRYCLTVTTFSDNTLNWTVGDVCQELIAASLSEPYYRHLEPESLAIYGTMGKPMIARDVKTLAAWCESRKDKKLYQLQVEMCEWAIAHLRQPDFLPDELSGSLRRDWVEAIDAEAKSIAKSKQAVLPHWPGAEQYRRYFAEGAEKARRRAAARGLK